MCTFTPARFEQSVRVTHGQTLATGGWRTAQVWRGRGRGGRGSTSGRWVIPRGRRRSRRAIDEHLAAAAAAAAAAEATLQLCRKHWESSRQRRG